MREVGVEAFKIVLIEEVKGKSKDVMRAREDHYIRLYDTCCNGLNGRYEIDQKAAAKRKAIREFEFVSIKRILEAIQAA
jgi:hypothetical protein